MGWETKQEERSNVAKECSYAEDEKFTIYFPQNIWDVMKKLTREVKLEWQVLLGGTIDEEKQTVLIHSYYIPDQEVTAASVKNNECNDKEFMETHQIVCGLHSHSNMGCSFSSIDEQTNLNIPFNVVINNKLQYIAGHYHLLPCGKKYFQSCEIIILSDKKEVEVEGMEKIKERKYKGCIKDKEEEDWFTDYNKDIPYRREQADSKRRHAFDFEMNEDIITEAIEYQMDPVRDLPGQRYLQFGRKGRP